MSIVLRSVKGSELTFAEVDGNFESLFYSSSISGNDLNLHFYGGTSQSINLNLIPALSASYAATASFVQNAQSASYVLNAISSSFASTIASGLNITASNILVTGTASIVFSQIITSSTAFTSGSNLLGANSGDKQTLWGTIDLKSGPLLISGSTTALGSITAPSFTGSLLGTASFATTASYVTLAQSASYVSSNFQYEVHVSQIDGNDTTGDGSLLKPVASITKALTLTTAQRRVIVLHPGGYTENPTISSGNITIQTTELTGGNTVLSGTLTIPTSGSGARISGFSMDNLAITGTAQAYISNCTVNNNVIKSSSGYVEIINSELQCISGIQISGAGITIINGNKNVGVAVSNASAQVIIKGCNSVVTPSASAGNLAIVDCIVTALGGNGITITGASTTLTLLNSQVLVQAGNNVAPISVAGIYSIINTIYDKPGSTITGTSTNSVDYFQYIDADNITTKGLTVTGSITVSGSVINNLTASYAISASNALTASYVLNAVSSSFSTFAQNAFLATTASYTLYTSLADAAIYAQNSLFATSSLSSSFASSSISASYSTNALSASFASSSISASFASNSISASYASSTTNASSSVSSSYSTYAENANTANSATTADSATIASVATSATSASYALTASYVENVVSSSFAQNAVTASYILNAVSASFASNSISSSFAQSAVTASFALSVIGGTFPFTGSAIISGSLTNIGNTVLSGSTVVQSSSLTVNTGSLFVNLPYDGVDNTTNAVIIDRGNDLQPALSVTGSSNFDGALNVNLGTLTAKDNLIVSGSSTFTNGGVTVKSGITITGPTLITGSTSITGSTIIVGNTTITGSLRVSGSITGSLLGTASFSQNAISASNISGAISNNTNDYILTATGGGSINGESGLTFDGTILKNNASNAVIKISDTVNSTTPTSGITSFVEYNNLPNGLGNYYGETISGIAGENLSYGQIIVLNAAAHDWVRASAEASNSLAFNLLGICLDNASDNDPITILLQGFVVTDKITISSYSPGQRLWLSNLTGTMRDTAPGTPNRLIGHMYQDVGAGYYNIRFNPDNFHT
jgi:hypothetical protein